MDDYAATQRLPDRSPAAESVHRASEHEKCAHLCGCAVLVCNACVSVDMCVCYCVLYFRVCDCVLVVMFFHICEILAESKSKDNQSMGQHSLSIADQSREFLQKHRMQNRLHT